MKVIVLIAFSSELRAGAVPAGVCIYLARYAVSRVFSLALIGLVLVSAGAACVRLGPTARSKVAPSAAFHTLLGLVFEFLGEAAGAADIDTIFQYSVSF